MRSQRDVREDLFVRTAGKAELDKADRFPAVGHGRVQASSAAVLTGFDHDRLAGERAPVRCSRQRHALSGLTALRARGELAPGVLESDQRLTAEVGDQKGDIVGPDRLPEPIAEDIDGSHRRRILDRREQFPQVQPRRSYVRHETTLAVAAGWLY